jgi:hypothetical protein
VRAVKVGKSYRILRSEMEAMTGAVRGASPSAVRVTSVVDVADVEPEAAQRLARLLPAARMAQEAHPDPMKIDVVYDPDRRQLKVLIVGSPGDTAAMLKMVEALSDS